MNHSIILPFNHFVDTALWVTLPGQTAWYLGCKAQIYRQPYMEANKRKTKRRKLVAKFQSCDEIHRFIIIYITLSSLSLSLLSSLSLSLSLSLQYLSSRFPFLLLIRIPFCFFPLLYEHRLPQIEPPGYRNYTIPTGKPISAILQDPDLWRGPEDISEDEKKRLPIQVQDLHNFWVKNHPWPDASRDSSRTWKMQRDTYLHAVDIMVHPFCCDAMHAWVRNLIVAVAYYPAFPAIRAP